MSLQPFDALQCAFALAARVGVEDELAVEQRSHIVVVEVVHHAVAEIGGKDLALDRVAHHKTHRRRRTVAAVAQLVVQINQVGLQVQLETQLAVRVALVAPRIVVGLEQIGEECVHFF